MILWTIIGIIVVYYVVGFILPASVTLATSLRMTGTSESIFSTIKDFRNWQEWAIWNSDNSMNVTISNPSNEVGSRYRWRSQIREIKDGLIVLTSASENAELNYDWYYGKRKRGTILFNIEQQGNHSFVTCSITIHNEKKIFARYFTQLIKKSILDNIEDVLLKIDERSM